MKKLLAIVIGVPVLLIVVFFIWLSSASSDIDLPDVTDLMPERVAVADRDNAYTYFTQAAAAADWPEDDTKLLQILNGEITDSRYVADILGRNQRAMTLLRRGLECNVCQMPEGHLVDDPADYISSWRTLSRLLLLTAVNAQETKRWEEATVACADLLKMGNLITRNAGGFTQYLVGLAFIDQGLAQTRKLANSPGMPADQLRALSDALADIDLLDRGLATAIKAEYLIHANTLDAIAEGKPVFPEDESIDLSDVRVGYMFQPNRTKAMFADAFRTMLDNAPLAVSERSLEEPEEGGAATVLSPNGVGKILYSLSVPCEMAVLEASARREGDVAATRLIVACRRYEKDHGELPPTLDALVPKYIDAVPRDPFDGKPMRYDHDRAIIYSVGKDLIDQGGAKPPTDNSSNEKADRWEAKDAVFEIGSREK